MIKTYMWSFDYAGGRPKLPALFKGQLYTQSTIMKYKQGKFKNTSHLERSEADKPPGQHLTVVLSSQQIS